MITPNTMENGEAGEPRSSAPVMREAHDRMATVRSDFWRENESRVFKTDNVPGKIKPKRVKVITAARAVRRLPLLNVSQKREARLI
jgi:hypothetical protein